MAKARKIFDVDISEITLCKSPANKKLFFITKSQEKPMKELIEDLKKFMAEEDEDAEKVLTKEDIAKVEKLGDEEAKALKEVLGIVSQYEDVPDDLEGVLKTLVKKYAFSGDEQEEIGKAGAKLSKTTQTQIKEALGHIKDGPKAVTILETLLGIEPKKKEKKVDDDKEENLSVEMLEKLERLEVLEVAEKERIKKAEDEKAKKSEEEKQDLLDRIEALEEGKPTRKSIDEPIDDGKKKKKKADDDEEDLFPSIPIPVIGD